MLRWMMRCLKRRRPQLDPTLKSLSKRGAPLLAVFEKWGFSRCRQGSCRSVQEENLRDSRRLQARSSGPRRVRESPHVSKTARHGAALDLFALEMRAARQMGEVRPRFQMATLAERGFQPPDHGMDRLEPKACRAATLAAEKRAHFCQDGIGRV
jgi:hypothetical protein